MSEPIIDARELEFAYPDGTRALNGVTFQLGRGEAVALIGANGAGKSTLLMHLNAYLAPTRGELRVAGAVVTKASAPAVRRAVGVVFQDPDDQLFMPTVLEDVAFGPLNAGQSPEQARQTAERALARVGLSHVAERPPYRLSAGEKRAAAIAAVLALEPDVLVMDEPSSNLDPRGRRRLINLLRSFGHARLIATHDLELVVEVCPRVLVMDSGRIVADGPTVALLNDEPLMQAHGLERPHILRHLHPHG